MAGGTGGTLGGWTSAGNYSYTSSATNTSVWGGTGHYPSAGAVYVTGQQPVTFQDCYFGSSPPSIKDIEDVLKHTSRIKLPNGKSRILELPDGTKIQVDNQGNFKINDKNAKVIYQGNRNREFNRYINASDLLEEFIDFLGTLGARQHQVLDIPINMFIHWLIIKAAEKDGESPPKEVPKVEYHPQINQLRKIPRCNCCGKFISKSKVQNGINFCGGVCMDKYWLKIGKAA